MLVFVAMLLCCSIGCHTCIGQAKKATKSDKEFFEQAEEKKALSEEAVARQKKVDTAILAKLDLKHKVRVGVCVLGRLHTIAPPELLVCAFQPEGRRQATLDEVLGVTLTQQHAHS